MNWRLIVTAAAEKQLRRLPKKVQEHIATIFLEMTRNPFGGDVQKLQGVGTTWRRRVGSYRVVYEIDMQERKILIYFIARRNSNTY